jgi:copper chaperone CopZ
LRSLPGVAKVEIDFPGRTATCTVDAEKFHAEEAIQALDKQGFANSTVKEPPS